MEYEAIIMGLELALQIPIANLTIYGYSKLVIKKIQGEYTIRKVY